MSKFDKSLTAHKNMLNTAKVFITTIKKFHTKRCHQNNSEKKTGWKAINSESKIKKETVNSIPFGKYR